jgi:hypothetical protein
MDHAEVLERIEGAVGAPGGLARLGTDPAPDAAALRQHLAGCPSCAAEWRAWSVVSLGLAAAAPDSLEPRPELKSQVMSAATARSAPLATPTAVGVTGSVAAVPPSAQAGAAPITGSTARSGIALGPRRPRKVPGSTGSTGSVPVSAAPPPRLLLLAAASVVVLFVVGIVLGRQLAGAPEVPRGDPGRVLTEAASILQGGGFGLARLETPDGVPGGVVVVSPGSGRLAVVSSALEAPPEGARYLCLLDRDGTVTQVGYMRWEPTASGGGLAYWAGDARPADLGLPGDVFVVQLDQPGAQPALSGEFQG